MSNLVDNLPADVYANIKKLMDNARTDVVRQDIVSKNLLGDWANYSRR